MLCSKGALTPFGTCQKGLSIPVKHQTENL